MENNAGRSQNQPKNKAIFIILALVIFSAGAFYLFKLNKNNSAQNNAKVKSAEIEDRKSVV